MICCTKERILKIVLKYYFSLPKQHLIVLMFNRRKFIWIQLIVQENLFDSNAEVNDATRISIKDSESKLCISKMTKMPVIWKHPQILVVEAKKFKTYLYPASASEMVVIPSHRYPIGFEWIVKGVWPRKSPVPCSNNYLIAG